MGKSSKPKVEVTKYFMAQHLGICVSVDALLAITVKEKLAWEGEVTTQTSFVADKDQLFGGPTKEGGFEAVVYWLPGASDQVLPDVLAQKLGRADGADAPGYRGIASAWFTGPKGTAHADYSGWTKSIKGRGGAYWTANNPYLPDVWFTVRRAPVGLNPDYALVPQEPSAIPSIEGSTVELTWWQRSADKPTLAEERARMGIGFLDENSALIGSINWAAYTNLTTWTERTHSAVAPALAIAVKIYIGFEESSGGGRVSAYIDDISGDVDGNPLTIINPGAESGTGGWAWEQGAIYATTAGAHSGSYGFHGDGIGVVHAIGSQTTVPQPITGADANPAHIIFEALTNTDWGMGSPETAIDKAGFEAIAVTLYAEGFGLSMLWTRQASIQDFIQEVLDHIQAVLFVDPATGLLTLKLIRGDYDPDTLDELTPDNAVLSSFSRKLWGEIANEIVVSWTNPDTEKEETTPPAQDLASIAAQGLISDSRNYYGVRNAALAQRLAWRELASAGQPLASFEAEVDRTQYLLRPASVIKVTWPEYALAGVVCRVTSVDYGRPGDMSIKLSLIEDVFGLDFGAYDEPPTSGWIDPSQPPIALTIEQIITMPLFFAANSSVAEFIDSPEYPEVVAGILATTDQADAFGYDLWDEVTLSNGSLEWQEIKANNNIIGHAELLGALAAEATSTGVSFDSFIGDTTPTLAGFVIIGDEGDEGNEIAQIDAVGATYTLRRGVLDTVPRAWPAATPVWFLDDETLFEDPRVHSAGETLDVKLLTRTSMGVLALGDAALASQDLTDRPWLPNRPANVQVDGVLFNTALTPVDMTARPDPWVPISWANRNRLLEDSQVLEWTDATMTPETGQTTGIEVIAEDGVTVIDTITGLSGTTHDVPDASFGSETLVLLRPFAERSDADGDFVSLQAHGIWVQVGASRLTEDGEFRLTEDGRRRRMED
jgi:hypothetical protein